jgi:hypothetical protein
MGCHVYDPFFCYNILTITICDIQSGFIDVNVDNVHQDHAKNMVC